ncbi:hypothetical protein GCM10010412_066520 [Nonomuraea recticatena]|uniref:Uncharacterized protein n=1 Tax=Nonomuraea recticatena TaxID=46178 RepID=A0ABN3SNW8_9ACTN
MGGVLGAAHPLSGGAAIDSDSPKPTPCVVGDVEALLWRLNDAFELLYEALTEAVIGIQAGDGAGSGDRLMARCGRRVSS